MRDIVRNMLILFDQLQFGVVSSRAWNTSSPTGGVVTPQRRLSIE
ncbi:MAG: hypothetical protein ACT4OP_01795 [Actinomycetota bacterium]